MHIKSLHKTSLIDFPGLISSTIFIGGCNFKCPYCYNPLLVYTPEKLPNIPDQEIISFLKSRKNLIDGVVLTGGEPTLEKGLSLFLEKIKSLDLRVKIDTNGYLPEVIKSLLKNKLIDYIAMDIKAPLSRYSEIAGCSLDINKITESISIIKENQADYEFRTTVWQDFLDEQEYIEVLKMICNAKNYYIQNAYELPDASPSNKYKPLLKKEIEPILALGEKYVENISLRGNWH